MKKSTRSTFVRNGLWAMATMGLAMPLLGLMVRTTAVGSPTAAGTEPAGFILKPIGTQPGDPVLEANDGETLDDNAYAVVCCAVDGADTCTWYSGSKCPSGSTQVACPCRQN